MALKEVKGYDLTGTPVISFGPSGVQQGIDYQLKLILGDNSDFHTIHLMQLPTTIALYAMKYKPEINTRYHPVLRARQNGLKPFSLKTVYIDPVSYSDDPKAVKALKVFTEQINTKKKKSLDLIGHGHGNGKNDGYFELENGSKHNVDCSSELITSAIIFGSDIVYRSQKVTGLNRPNNNFNVVRLSTDNINSFAVLNPYDSCFSLLEGFDFDTGAAKNVRISSRDDRYSAEGLLNELAQASESGINIAVKEVTINDFSNDVYSSDVTVEKDGKLNIYKLPVSNGLIIGQLFDVPMFLEYNLVDKVKQIEKLHQQMQQKAMQIFQAADQDDNPDSDDISDSDDDKKKEPN